jgi:hypothetical protein
MLGGPVMTGIHSSSDDCMMQYGQYAIRNSADAQFQYDYGEDPQDLSFVTAVSSDRVDELRRVGGVRLLYEVESAYRTVYYSGLDYAFDDLIPTIIGIYFLHGLNTVYGDTDYKRAGLDDADEVSRSLDDVEREQYVSLARNSILFNYCVMVKNMTLMFSNRGLAVLAHTMTVEEQLVMADVFLHRSSSLFQALSTFFSESAADISNGDGPIDYPKACARVRSSDAFQDLIGLLQAIGQVVSRGQAEKYALHDIIADTIRRPLISLVTPVDDMKTQCLVSRFMRSSWTTPVDDGKTTESMNFSIALMSRFIRFVKDNSENISLDDLRTLHVLIDGQVDLLNDHAYMAFMRSNPSVQFINDCDKEEFLSRLEYAMNMFNPLSASDAEDLSAVAHSIIVSPYWALDRLRELVGIPDRLLCANARMGDYL